MWWLLSPVRLFVTSPTIQLMEFSRPEYWPFPSPGDLPNSEIKPRSPTMKVDSLPAKPSGNPKNTGVGSLYFLHGNFPNRELSWLLHCRWILYQLSYQGSPKEGWSLNNWCFQIVVLEKTFESPLDCKEIKPVHPKGNQSWIFIERTDAET